MTNCIQQTFAFQGLGKRKVEADFRGGNVSADGGGPRTERPKKDLPFQGSGAKDLVRNGKHPATAASGKQLRGWLRFRPYHNYQPPPSSRRNVKLR